METKARELIDGAELIVRGAIDAGCTFFAGYPITPATPILLKMYRELPSRGGIVLQGEDEIASISMCIGASLAGAKALTATSGPGMSLYSENIGLALMAEVPLVIVDVQRLGPATGAATTGAEGDVLFSRYVTSGGIPMVILSPSTVPELYHMTIQAFNTAEKLRIPVILLTSKDMVLSTHTICADELYPIPPFERSYAPEDVHYIPYKFERPEDVPPFLPVGARQRVRATTSMHDAYAYITKDPEKIEHLITHLVEKIRSRRNELSFVEVDLQHGSDTLLITYGITALTAREAVRRYRDQGGRISHLVMKTLFPIPEEPLTTALEGVSRVLIPELNVGLYYEAIRTFIPDTIDCVSYPKFNGELFTVDELLEFIEHSSQQGSM